MPTLTFFDDNEEMTKGRQKELNSLKEMGTMTVKKTFESIARERFQSHW